MCCGVGIQAFFVRPFCQKVLGIDINEHAVGLAKTNASLNRFSNCAFERGVLFEGINERFDLIVSNPPFIFFEDFNNRGEDSDGKQPYGLGVTINIIKALPAHLKRNGWAFIITRSPVFKQGDYLFDNLSNFLHRDFGCNYRYISDSINPLASFERNLGIKGYRYVILEIFRGGNYKIMEYPFWHRKTNIF
jgi:methylase of polypeptide subunit release factors